VTNVRGDARSDAALLVALENGDRDALTVLYHRHAAWLSRRLQYRCRDEAVVDAALHDTFVAVWRKPGSYKGTGDVGAWMWGIAIRRLIDQLRRTKHVPMPAVVEAAVVAAEDEALIGIEHGDLAAAVESLSPELYAVVQAMFLDGLTSRETARLLGLPQGTVKTRIARARSQLRVELIGVVP
jgi:RNA polymerase sigma-70 factor (ECF subfamily)